MTPYEIALLAFIGGLVAGTIFGWFLKGDSPAPPAPPPPVVDWRREQAADRQPFRPPPGWRPPPE